MNRHETQRESVRGEKKVGDSYHGFYGNEKGALSREGGAGKGGRWKIISVINLMGRARMRRGESVQSGASQKRSLGKCRKERLKKSVKLRGLYCTTERRRGENKEKLRGGGEEGEEKGLPPRGESRAGRKQSVHGIKGRT